MTGLPVSVLDPAGMEVEMSNRITLLLAVLCAAAAPGVVSTAAAQATSNAEKWEVPRTPDGHPDLQGNWSNSTLTPFERREDQGPVTRGRKSRRSSGQQVGAPLTQGPSRVEGWTTKGMGL